MKLEVGMYVRTKNGYIRKIERKVLDNEGFLLDEEYYNIIIEEETFGIIPKEDVSKASHNIIDLVRENDFVNGEKVSSIQYDGMGFEHIKCVQTICKFDDLDNRFYTETYFNKDIKSIVTKEQFSQMEYKIGE